MVQHISCVERHRKAGRPVASLSQHVRRIHVIIVIPQGHKRTKKPRSSRRDEEANTSSQVVFVYRKDYMCMYPINSRDVRRLGIALGATHRLIYTAIRRAHT